METGERIKRIREEKGLSMANFGARIGVSSAAINNLEKGKTNPSTRTIRLICAEFGVREDWLLTGDGPMVKPPGDEITAVVDKYHLSPVGEAMVRTLVELPPEAIDVVYNYAKRLVANVEGMTSADLHKELDRQMDEEKNPAGISEATSRTA